MLAGTPKTECHLCQDWLWCELCIQVPSCWNWKSCCHWWGTSGDALVVKCVFLLPFFLSFLTPIGICYFKFKYKIYDRLYHSFKKSYRAWDLRYCTESVSKDLEMMMRLPLCNIHFIVQWCSLVLWVCYY